MGRLGMCCLLVCASGCMHLPFRGGQAAPKSDSAIQQATYTEEAHSPRKPVVYVMSNGFHTGLILHNDDIPREAWPEVEKIPDHPWVEIGWGSEIFYRAKKITGSVVLGAMVPNASVLHVVGWDKHPEKTFARADLIRLELEKPQLALLCEHIHKSYELDAEGTPQDLGPGIYGDGRFFRARGKYYFPNTCNAWTARGLQSAGVPIVPELCAAADPVLMAARAAGTTIHRR